MFEVVICRWDDNNSGITLNNEENALATYNLFCKMATYVNDEKSKALYFGTMAK